MSRRIKTSPVVRQEMMARKREADLERMLLPDAPPRKRQSKRISPERQPCIMVEPSTSGAHFAEPYPAGPADVEASMSSSFGTETAEATSCTSDPVDAIIEFDVASNVGDTLAPFEIRKKEVTIWTDDHDKCDSIKEWLQQTDLDSGSDDELDMDDDACIIPTSNERNATTEPACDSDLTLFQAEVLRREDEANDQAVRDIAPDDCCTFVWSKDRTTFTGQRETFTCTSGPTFDVSEQTRAIDIFDKMFDSDFIDLIVTETNRNAKQKIALLREQNKLAPHSRFNRWTPTDRNEMISFLAIIILQGLYASHSEEAYFSYNNFGTMPYFAKIMSYNRFLLLKIFLHFYDRQTCQDTTRLCKIRPVIDFFNDKFSSLYMPSQEIAIDESLLKWHGRLSFTQKISSKAAQVGVKTYELCESSSGYLWKFFVYTGKDKSTTTNDSTADEQTTQTVDDDETNDTPDRSITSVSEGRPTNATAKIVYDLIEPLLNRGHTVIMDNFYNSPLLARSLKRQKTDCYGTLRLNREFVPDSVKTLTKTDLRQGEVVATYCSDLAILVWRDANIVSMISTYHNLQIGTQDKNNQLTYKPNIVLDYNKNMGGVDRKDQFLSAQPMERLKTRVWYKKLFRRLYNAAIFNCFVIFSSFHRKISHRQFRTVLAEDLLRRHRQIDLTTEYRRWNIRLNTTGQVKTTMRPKTGKRTQARPIVEANHFPIRTGSRYTCCFLCPKKTRTIWKCEECDVNLCIEGCFKAYHKP